VDALGGRVIFVDTAVPPTDVYLTTATEVLTVAPEPVKRGLTAVEAMPIPKAEGRLRVLSQTGVALPSLATVAFSACTHNERVTLSVNVTRDGEVRLPLLVPCRSLTLSFDGLGTLGLAVSVPRSRWRPWT
jgi:hypothetical protein